MAALNQQHIQTIESMVKKHFEAFESMPQEIRLRQSTHGSTKLRVSELTLAVNNYLQKEGIVKRGSDYATSDVIAEALTSLGYQKSFPYSRYAFSYKARSQ